MYDKNKGVINRGFPLSLTEQREKGISVSQGKHVSSYRKAAPSMKKTNKDV